MDFRDGGKIVVKQEARFPKILKSIYQGIEILIGEKLSMGEKMIIRNHAINSLDENIELIGLGIDDFGLGKSVFEEGASRFLHAYYPEIYKKSP